MVDAKLFRQLALAFVGTEEAPHFNRIAFKITDRKIFATLLVEEDKANLFLSLSEQEIYTAYDNAAVCAVANKWGQQGWTTFELKKLPVELVSSALHSAYQGVLAKTANKKKKA